MQEKTVLKISQDTLKAILKEPLEIKELLLADLQKNQEKIRLMVSGYFFMERKRVYNLTVDTESVQIDEAGSGSFSVFFTIGILDGCADIDRSVSDRMSISITTNLETGHIFLSGEEFPERYPDDF